MKNFSKIVSAACFSAFCFLFLNNALSQINIAPGGTVTQNFNSVTTGATSLPSGWKLATDNVASGQRIVQTSYTAAGTTAGGNTMSLTSCSGISGGGYSLRNTTSSGVGGTDYSVGFVGSGSIGNGNLYVALTNNGSSSISSFTISYSTKKYRNGNNAAGFTVQMLTATSASAVTTGWTALGSSFNTVFASDGNLNCPNNTTPGNGANIPNATSNVTSQTYTLGTPLGVGSTVYFAWNYAVSSGTTSTNAPQLGIDDISITANSSITFDGNINESLWGARWADSIGGPTSGFGNAFGLNALYSFGDATDLYFGIAGRHNSANDALIMFIDSKSGGYTDGNFGRTGAPGGIANFNSGTTFDSGFTADYCVSITSNGSGTYTYNVFTLAGTAGGGGGSNSVLSAGNFGTSAVLNGGLTRGFEFRIPKTSLGYTCNQELRVMAMITANTGFLSNLFLSRAGSGDGNYGSGAVNFGSATPNPVTIGVRTIATGNYSAGTTWNLGTGSPTNVAITINGTHTMTVDAAASVNNITVNSTGVFASGAFTTTVGAGSTISNAGTFTPAAGTISFAGAGTISGATACTLNNLTINTGTLTLTTAPTINGVFSIVGGNVSAAPFYGTSSTLQYVPTAGSYGRFNEWATGTTSNASAGYPFNVTIGSVGQGVAFTANNSANLQLGGTLTIGAASGAASSFTMNEATTPRPVTVVGAVAINATGTLTLGNLSGANAGDLNVAGNFTNNGTFNANNRLVNFNGSAAAQTLTGNTTFDFLTVNNTSGTPTVTLQASSAVTVNSNVNFANGRIVLGANNLTLGASATVSTPTTAKYFVTNSTGLLIRPVSTSAVTFPVGNSSYNPVTLTPSIGTNIPYRVRVIDAVTSPAPFNATRLINRYWSITAPTAPANTLTMQGQWNTGEANANYAAGTQVKVAYHNGTAWTETNSTQVGSNPFTSSGAFAVTAGNINAGITFGIGKDDGFINPAITYTWNGSTNDDWGTNTNWTPTGIPTAIDNIIIPTSASYTDTLVITGTRACFDYAVNGNGTYSMAASSSLTINGNISHTSSVAATYDCSSSFVVTSAATRPIPPANYGNLLIGGGTRSFSSGTTRICGNYVPGSFTLGATSTIEFNGTAAQSINTNAPEHGTINITNTSAPVTANVAVAALAMNINANAVYIQASGALVITNATVNINGTLRNSSTSDISQVGATVTVGATGTYDHNRGTGASNLLVATWVAGSNCRVSGAPSVAPGNLGQSFSDFTWSAAMTGGFSLSGGLTTVNRDFVVTTTNSQNLGLTATTGLVLNVGRDMLIQGGNVIGVTGANTNTVDINVADDLTITGSGSLIVAGSGSSGVATTTFDVADSVIVNSTSTAALVITDNSKAVTLTAGNSFNKLNSGTCSLVDGTGTGTLTITSGNFNILAGVFNMVSGSTGLSVINQSSASHGMILSGGTFNALASTAGAVLTANRPIINLSGSFNQSGSSTFEFAAGSVTSTANPMGELRVAGNFIRTGAGGMSVTSVNAPNNALLLFNGAAQNYDATGLTGDFSYVNTQVSNGSVLTLLTDMTLYGNPQTVTVLSGGQIDFGTRIITSGAALGTTFTANSGSTLKTANQYGFTTATTGATGGSVQLNTRVYNSNSSYIFNGGAGQGTGNFFNGTTATANTINNLTIDNASNVALDAPATVNGTLTLTNGHLVIGNNNLVATTISGASASRHIKTTGTGLLRQGVGSPGATGAIFYPVGNAAYNPITLTSSATIDVYGIRVVDGAVAAANDNTKAVNRAWVINEAIAGGSNFAVVAQYNSGEEGTNFATATTPYIGFYKGSPNWVQQSATPAGSGPFTYTSGANFTPTDMTTGTQYLAVGKDDAFLAPVSSYSWNGSTNSNWNTTTNWTPNGTPGVTDDIVIDSTGVNTLDLGSGSFSCTAITVSGTGKFDISGTGTLTVAGAVTYTSSASPTLNCGSTVIFSSSSSVAIPAWDYGNLDASGGPRVLASSGTIGICGSFTRGGGAYTVTGSTVDYKGTGAQSIAAGLYNNMTISQSRGGLAITLPAATIDLAGTFNPSLSNFTVTVSTNTFNFSGAGTQSFPAFFYYNVTNTGNGNRTWASSGIIDINNTFTPSTGSNTVTGSTVRYSSTAATAYTLTSFTSSASPRHYNNLELVGGASTTWTLASGFNLGCAGNFSLTGAGTFTVANNATANTMTVDGTFTLSGAGTVRVSNTATATIVGALNVTGNTTISNGVLNLVGPSAGTTVQGNFTTNDLAISVIGQLLLDAASNTSVASATVNGSLSVTSTLPNAINLGSGTANANNLINIRGDFTKSGTGTLGFTGSFSTTSGYNFNGTTTQLLNFSGANMTAGSFTVAAGSTVQLASNMTLGSNATASGFSILGNGILNFGSFSLVAGNAANTFSLSSTGTFRTASTTGVAGSLSGFTVGNCAFASGGTFDFTGTAVNTGFSSFTGITTSNSYTISWNGTTSLTLDKTVNLNAFNFNNSGLIYLGSFDMSLPSAAGGLTGTGFATTKMFVTNGTGSLSRAVTAAGVGLPFTWPIGDTTGTTQYSPVSVSSIATPGIPGAIAFRVVDGIQPNMSPAVSYLSRYWPMALSGFNNTYSLSTLTFTYDAGDIVVGPEASLKGNAYSTGSSSWTEFVSSSAGSGVLTITSGINGTVLPTANTYDLTGRIDVPVYYRSAASNNWTNASTTWEISTDPAFIAPGPVPATTAPNPANSAGITIRNGHTVTVNTSLSADQLVIQSGGILSVTANSLTVANGAGTDVTIDSGGTIQFSSSTNNSLIMAANSAMQVNGLFKQMSTASPDFTINTGAVITVGATGTYEHARNAGIIPTCTWASGSTCLLTGIGNNLPSGLSQSFHHFTVNSTITASVNCSGNLQTVLGKLKITTNHPTNEFRLSTGTSFTLTVADSLIINNAFVSIASGGAGPCNIVANGPTLVTGNSILAKTGAATANFTFNGNYQQDAGSTFEFNSAGSSNTTVNFRGNVIWNGTILRTNGGTHTVNFDKTSGLQTWTSNATYGAGLINWNIGTGSTTNTVQLLSDIALSSSEHVFNVRNGSTFNMGPYILSGTNTDFSLNATGAIKLGHAAGIVTAPTLDGNVRTLTRTFPGTASYFYNGTANQATGNALPGTLTGTGNLNIEASSGVVVTLTNNNTTTPTFNLISGLFAAGNTQQLNITSGGTVNSNGGDWVTGVNAGLLNFPGSGTFAGTGNCNPYNVYTSGGVNFGTDTVTIQNGGTFRINSGGFVNTNAPFYAAGSTLQYWVSTTYGRGLEWSAASGRGFPHHVSLGNNSLLNPADAGAVDANVPFRTAGNVTIDFNSAIYMDLSGNNMIEDLVIGGNFSMTGQLSGSGTSGSDIYVAGDWTNNGPGANFFPNNRGVFLNGTATQTISGTNPAFPAFPFLLIDKTAGVVNLSRDVQVSNTLTFTAPNVANINATGFTMYVSSNATGAISRPGSGHVIGNLRREMATGSNTYNFTIGDAGVYAPVSIAANSVTVGGSMTASTTTPDHPQIASSGLDNTKSVNRYWSISQTGLTLTNYSPTFNFVTGDVDGGVNTNNLLVGRHNAGWTYPTVGTRTATSTQATGVTAYGDFALAECKTPAAFAVTGGGSYCSGGAGISVGLAGSEAFVSYQLQINGVDTLAPVIGTGAAINFGNMTSAGVYTVEASNLASFGCLSNMTGSVEVIIIPTVTPSVSITSTPAGSVCAGTSVSFSAVGQFGGVTPTYQWQLNGTNVGTNSTSYNLVAPANGDVVRCIFTSSEVCPAPASDTSNVITLNVLAFQTPAVSIVASPSNNICSGDNVTFTATPTFGGGTPSYQWRLNGSNVGSNSPTYSNAALATGNQVDCILTSDYQCLLSPTANSNIITMNVTPAPQVNAGSAMTTCGLTAYAFANGASNSNTTGILWTENGAGSITAGATTLTPTYTPAAGDIGNVVTFTLTGTGNSPCGAVIDQVTLTVTPLLNWYVDADGDGFGAPGIPVVACTNPGGRVTNNQDCCDTNADVNPLSEWWADLDGDGYGSFVFDIGCFTGVSCSNTTWFGLIPYYPGAHSNIPYALDCNDNQVSVNPGMNEVCGNNTDDDCNGTIDIGCNSPQNDAFTNSASVTVNNPNAYYPNCQIFNGSVTNAGISAQGNPANVSVGAGRDVWYRFVAPSTGVQIKVQPVGFDAVIELRTAAHPVGQVDVENVNNTVGGLEILNSVSLVAGTTYYVGVRNFNATNTGTFTICISPLLQSGCGLTVPVGGFSTCANYKAIYRGAATYTFNFTGTGGAAAFPFVTTVGTTAGLIPLSTPALDIRYGGIYSCRVDANYALFNGVGAPEPLTILGNTSTANCTNIQIMTQPNVEVRSSQRCPATLTRSAFLVGTAVSGNTIICGATGYRYRFTKVTDCTGLTTAGLPVTYNTPGNTPFLNLASVFPAALPNIGYWRVEIAPIFSYGLGNYGPVQVIQVTGSSTSMMLPELNEGMDANKSQSKDALAGIYPNPNNGEMVNINLTGLTSESVSMRIYDSFGRLVTDRLYAVDGNLNTIVVFDQQLVSGIYTIDFRCGDDFFTQRMIVQN
jgi:hypothetical protein